jgi:cation:H+ antiporter
MTTAALLLVLLSLDGKLTGADAAILLLGGIAYMIGLSRVGRSEAEYDAPDSSPERADPAEPVTEPRQVRQALVLLAGLVAIVLGAELLVDGAVSTARSFGLSDSVIGLTIVAIGTSAPELVTTVVSTLRGDRQIAVGNLLGSSIYNIFLVLGLTVLVAPGGVPDPDEVLAADLVLLAVVAVVAVATVPVFVSGSRITRAEGGLFVGTTRPLWAGSCSPFEDG